MSYRSKERHEHKIYSGSVDHRGQNSKNESSHRKSPLRVQNDWSEHISSKGLIYYYNCRTEVSQWQRPAEWTLPQMTPDEIKRCLNNKNRNGDHGSFNLKRSSGGYSEIKDVTTSPKRIKYCHNTLDRKPYFANPTSNKPVKIDVKPTKLMVTQIPVMNGTKNNKFNDDDMDISPGSSPLSNGSNSPDCDKKTRNQIQLESQVKNGQNTHKIDQFQLNYDSNTKKISSDSIVNLTPYQTSLVTALRSVQHSLKTSHNTNNSEYTRTLDSYNNNQQHQNCLSVYQISDLMMRMDAVSHNGDTCNSYRSHRLQAQLSQGSVTTISSHSNGHNSHQSLASGDQKSLRSQQATISQVKELVRCLQQFVQEQYPNINTGISPVSPNYSKTNKISHYIQILSNLIETCLIQLCPQSLNSPSSTSSPGSLKDNTSNISVSTSVASASCSDTANKPDLDSPIKKDKYEEKPRSILQDSAMLKYVSPDITNTYRNHLADCYEKEAQMEYYKFVKLHSVLYSDLACESKKLKALVRISEINTELLRQKKEDLEKLILMLESRRLPSHLKCDYISSS